MNPSEEFSELNPTPFTDLTVGEIKNALKALFTQRQTMKRQPQPTAPLGSISLREASRLFGIPNGTISRWVSKGLIPVLLRTKNKLHIDRSILEDIIYIYKAEPGQGKRTINKKLVELSRDI